MFRLLRGWAVIFLMVTAPAFANDSSGGGQRIANWWEGFKQDVNQTWEEPQNYDLYLPVLSWHNRLTYEREKTKDYNEMPWGGGFGVSRYNEQGDWSTLYAMMFKDSHSKWQPIIGYGWEKGWYLDENRDFRLGFGYTAGITARDDFANYVPLPIILPLFSAGYQRVTVQFTYIPGTWNNGNVLFAWLRYAF